MVHPELIYSTTKSAVELFLSFHRNRATPQIPASWKQAASENPFQFLTVEPLSGGAVRAYRLAWVGRELSRAFGTVLDAVSALLDSFLRSRRAFRRCAAMTAWPRSDLSVRE